MTTKTKITNIILNWKQSGEPIITTKRTIILYMVGFSQVATAIYLSLDILFGKTTKVDIAIMAMTGVALLYIARMK